MNAEQIRQDRELLRAASKDSDDWDNATWAAWWRTAERHDPHFKRKVTTAAAVAAQGALPVPVGVKPLAPQGQPRTMLDRARDALNARMTKDDLRLVLENVITHADALNDRIAELENALAATGRSLSSFIFDSDDPGTNALGAQWLYHQAMPQADDPFAQPRAFRSSVFSEASKAVEGMEGRPSDGEYSREYLNGYSHALEDVAEHLEKRADQAAEGTEATS
jgi:hypothetical protein